MQKTFNNVNIIIEDNGSNGRDRVEKRHREISANDLAKIIDNTSNKTIRQAFQIVCFNHSNRIIGLAQALHGVIYSSYYHMSKTIRNGR